MQHRNFDTPKSVTTTSSSNHPPQPQQPPLDWVDTVVNCANIMNKIFTRNTCRLCHIYSDKQVEFEERIQQNATITATAAEWYNVQQQSALYNNGITSTNGTYSNNNDANDSEHDTMYQPQSQPPSTMMLPPNSVSPVNPEAVELYRKYLFDEESVVDSIELRIGRSTDDDDAVQDDDTDEMKDVQLT